MIYYIGQSFGILMTVCCLVLPLFKKKWQMLVVTAVINACAVLNLTLIGQVGSGVFLCIVGVLQALVSLWHVLKEKPVTRQENILFFVLYMVFGVFGFRRVLDLLPLTAAIFNMLATFQRDEQKSRVHILINSILYLIYYLLVGSASVLAEVCIITTSILALYRYRKR